MSKFVPSYIEQGLRIEHLERELAEKTRLLSETDVAVIKIANQADEYLQQRNVAIAKVEGLRVRFERELAEAVAAERERCAKVCEERGSFNSMYAHHILTGAAEAIRKGE